MRVTIDYTPAARQGAGIGRYTRELVQALARLDPVTAYTLLLFGRPAFPASLAGFPPNFSIHQTRLSERSLTRLWRLGAPLPVDWLAGRADVYYSPNFTLPPLRAGRALITVHDLSFLRVPDAAETGLRAYLAQAVPRAVARADHILADSAHTKADLVELLGVAPDKVTVVYSAAGPSFRPLTDPHALAEVRARYRLEEPFFLGLGTLEPRKNLGRLIEAFARLRARGRPHQLVLAGGRGWLDDPIFAQVERWRVKDSVRFLGFVPDADLPALYSLADAFAFPSLYEGFGLPPLEALACGTPTVVSNASSLPEVVGDAALLVDPLDVAGLADALDRLAHDEALRARLRAAGPVQAARFTWEGAAGTLRRVLARLA